MGWLYGAVLALRNWYYDRVGGRRAGVPVVSIGNITVGGSGKTPMAIWAVERLHGMGRRPAIVMRGYKGSAVSPGDEVRMLRARLPEVPVVANPDRLAGAAEAARRGADVVVLDDGFQHRRLGSDLELVLIDATCPFGYGRVLPAGLLREPLAGLRRADLIVLTRADQVSPAAIEAIAAELHRRAPDAPVIRATHDPVGLVGDVGAGEVASPASGRPVLAFSGIGNPGAFERTLRSTGLEVREALRFADHHRYGPADVERICALAKRAESDMIVTTEKDLVKLPAGVEWPAPLRALRVTTRFEGDGERLIGARLAEVCGAAANGQGHRAD